MPLWHKEATTRPYQKGRADEVIKMNWKRNSTYGPADGWFHQHFNTGPEPARHLAIRTGSRLLRSTTRRLMGDDAPWLIMREGGNLIDYEDEDPQVRRDYIEALKKQGVECAMPAVRHR